MDKCTPKTEVHTELWSELSDLWPQLGAPWRPSRDDIRIYRQLSLLAKTGKVLIWGCDPELRDLIAEQREKWEQVIIVDANPDMFRVTNNLLKLAEPEFETRIISSWQSANLSSSSFTLILGDVFWHWLSKVDQKNLSKRISELLLPEGLFISRFRVENPRMNNKVEMGLAVNLQNALHQQTTNQDWDEILKTINKWMHHIDTRYAMDYNSNPYPIATFKKYEK